MTIPEPVKCVAQALCRMTHEGQLVESELATLEECKIA